MSREPISTNGAPAAIGPYSQGIRAGGFVFVSGQTPLNPADGTIPEGIAAQTEQGLKNVRSILEAAGCSLSDVVEVGVFLKDMNDFAEMNGVYESFFEKPYPARAAVEAARLPLDVLVEIKAIAVAGD